MAERREAGVRHQEALDCRRDGCDRPVRYLGLCIQHYNADYHQRNKEKRNAQTRARSASDPERARREAREQYLEHRAEYRARSERWKAANRERHLELMREWGRTNADRRKMLERAREARKRGNGVFVITTADLLAIVRRQDHRCAYCRRPFGDGVAQQWDHVVPIARGGRHSVGNLVAACADCNVSKGSSYVTEWRKRVATA